MDNAVADSTSPPNEVPSRRRRPGAWVVAAVALALFLVLAAAVSLSSGPYFGWDLTVSRAAQSAGGAGLDYLMRGVSLAGDELAYSVSLLAAAGLVLLVFRARREAVVLVGIVLAGQALKIGVKDLVRRPRPSPELVHVRIPTHEVFSFPSGHTVHYVVFFGFLWFLAFALVKRPALRWPLLAVFGGLVALVGLARIYLGEHWASDVLGGYLLGGAVLAAGVGVYGRWAGTGL